VGLLKVLGSRPPGEVCDRFLMCCGSVREDGETVGERGSFVPFGMIAVDRDFLF
jgi:hypothetical protein